MRRDNGMGRGMSILRHDEGEKLIKSDTNTNSPKLALETGKVSSEEALDFNNLWQVKALETGKIIAEEALKFTNIYQAVALETGKVSSEEALDFNNVWQVKALETGKVTAEEAHKSNNINDNYDGENIDIDLAGDFNNQELQNHN